MTADHPVVDFDAVGWLDETQMIEVDRVMTVTLGKPAEAMGPVPAHQLAILEPMRVPVQAEPVAAEVVIDALVNAKEAGET